MKPLHTPGRTALATDLDGTLIPLDNNRLAQREATSGVLDGCRWFSLF